MFTRPNKSMNINYRYFSYLAITGFFISLVIHVFAYFDIDNLQGIFICLPVCLSVGIVVVWLPAMVAAFKLTGDYLPKGGFFFRRIDWSEQKKARQALLRGCSNWTRYLFVGLLAYTFILLWLPAFMIILYREQTEAQFIYNIALSGWPVGFYYAAFVVLTSYANVLQGETFNIEKE